MNIKSCIKCGYCCTVCACPFGYWDLKKKQCVYLLSVISMKKSKNNLEAILHQPLEQDVVHLSLMKDENENFGNLHDVLSVALLMLDKIALEIGSKNKLELAYLSVRHYLKDNKEKQKILEKLVAFMEKRRNDNPFVKCGFF